MKKIVEILNGIEIKSVQGSLEKTIQSIQFDSRKIKKDDLFVAVKGTQVDGHQFIENAVGKGATIVVAETLPQELNPNCTYVQVEDSAKVLGVIAAGFYNNPSRKLKLVGVTGTNGKTSTVTLLYKLFSALGYQVGLLSTVENRIGDQVVEATHTTPDAVQLNELLDKMVNEGCSHVFMEVSSHALAQERTAGLYFTGGVFTNMSHDHLDFHETFDEYIKAKKKFFDELPKESFALINVDDKRGTVMVQNSSAQVSDYGLRTLTDFKGKILENRISGLLLQINGVEFHSRLIGEFNAYNLLAVFGTAIHLEEEQQQVLEALSNLESAEGRFDYIKSRKSNRVAIVDYAHTPDALEKVLTTIKDLKTKKQKVLTVVGCGGDRDKSKRPIMAAKAIQFSDQVILTSDNPRTEEPEAILKDMEAGVKEEDEIKVITISDRKQAIKVACSLAQEDDIILIAGKGHEKYQEIKGIKHPFDDKEMITQFLK